MGRASFPGLGIWAFFLGWPHRSPVRTQALEIESPTQLLQTCYGMVPEDEDLDLLFLRFNFKGFGPVQSFSGQAIPIVPRWPVQSFPLPSSSFQTSTPLPYP